MSHTNTIHRRVWGYTDKTALTGLGRATVDHIVNSTRPPTRRGRPPSLSHDLRVLIVLCALRTNLTERALAAIFDTSQSVVHRTIKSLLPVLAGLLDDTIPDRPLLLDGTLIPVHDQTRTACSKNYRHSVNIQVVATLDRRVVHVGAAWPGNRNDIVVARNTLPAFEDGQIVLADGAYRSLPGITIPPPRTEHTARSAHRQLRARIEHVIARLKDWQILRQCRRRGHSIDLAFRAVAYIYNLHLELRINS